MRRGRGAMASSKFVIAILLLQGCAIKWWGSESGQEGPAQVELIKEPAIKDILPDDGLLIGWRTSSATQSELLSRNANSLMYGTLDDVLFDIDQDIPDGCDARLGGRCQTTATRPAGIPPLGRAW